MKLQTKLDHVQDHIGNVRKFQEIIMQNLFSDHNAIKLEIRKKKISNSKKSYIFENT